MSQEEDYRNQLAAEINATRNKPASQSTDQGQGEESQKKPRPSVKNFAKNVASAVSLFGLVEIRDVFFASAIISSMLKDITDAGIIGTILTPLNLIVTLAAMLICGSNNLFGKRKATTLLLGNLFEILPGLNFLPVATLSTILIYVFTLRERKEKSLEQKKKKAEANSSV
jgi:hypothetical protein